MCLMSCSGTSCGSTPALRFSEVCKFAQSKPSMEKMARITSQRWEWLGAYHFCSTLKHLLQLTCPPLPPCVLCAPIAVAVPQAVGSAMPLVGEHQAEDRQLIADMVLAEMNELAEKEANAPQKPTTMQPSQVGQTEISQQESFK